MFKLILILVVVAIFILLMWVLYTAVIKTTAHQASRAQKRGWRVESLESEAHPITTFFLARGDRREYFGSVDRLDEDYDDKLYHMRAAAEDEATDRNLVNRTLNS